MTEPQTRTKYLYDQSSYSGLTITNGIGRRTGMTDQAGSEAWSYDPMGRPLTVKRTTNGLTESFVYSYNLDGSPYQLTYPGQSSPVTYTPGGAGRQLQLVSGGGTYISANAHYAPNGDLCYRQDDWDGSWTTTKTFNNRFQPATIQSVQQFSGTPPPVCGISQIYSGGCCSSVLDLSYSFTDASGHNNGNVQRISNNLNSQRTELFSYDTLNRLSTAETSSTYATSPANCWGEQYTYDAWGNLSGISGASSAYNGCTQESLSMSPTTKNQLQDTNSDFVYDSAGNLTQPGPSGGTYVFDAENHLTSAGGVTYTYDGDGNRVMKSNGTIYWYGANSASLVETDLTGDILRWYYFFNGQRVARQLYTNEVGFYMTDHLGNVRYLGGSANGYSIDYYPFGGIIVNSDIGDDRYQFTGKERDSESGLDNFGLRYLTSSMGRFMSPDPGNISGLLHQDDPQSWNAYSYVRNNPINLTDENGDTYHVCVNGENNQQQCTDVSDEQFAQLQKDPGAGISLRNGDVYANGSKVGSYNQTDVDLPPGAAETLSLAGNMAAPGVNFAANGLRMFGYAVAAPLMVAAECGAGAESCTKGNVAMAILPEVAALREGGIVLKEAAAAGKGAEKIRKLGGAVQAAKDFEGLQGAEKVYGTTRVKTLSDGTKAVLYNSTSEGVTIAIQEGGRTVTKFRY